MKKNLTKLCERLRELRGALSQAQFARELELKSQQTYQRYEEGQTEPTASLLSSMAEHCGVTTDWLLGRSDDRKAVYLEGAGEQHVVRETPGTYGKAPPYHTVAYVPDWSGRMGEMSRDDLCEMIEDRVPRLRTKDLGEPMIALCHQIMDILNELANRKAKEDPK